jgi:Rrf2 family protein
VLGIGRHTDYAARIVLHLACLPEGTQVTADEISRTRLLPPSFIRRIVGRLAAAGILRTTRGAGGGVTLARPPGEISLFDVVAAMEGGVTINACVDTPRACPLAEACPVQRAWTGVTRSLEAELAAVRFDRLADPLEHRVAHSGYDARQAATSGRTTHVRKKD